MSIAASISLARSTAAFRRAPRGAAAPRRASLQTVAAGKNILYDVPVSNNGARNRLIVYWKGVEDQFTIANPSEVGGIKSEEYLAMNPQGKMPLLVTADGLALPESEVISQYICHAFDEGPELSRVHTTHTRTNPPRSSQNECIGRRRRVDRLAPHIGCRIAQRRRPVRHEHRRIDFSRPPDRRVSPRASRCRGAPSRVSSDGGSRQEHPLRRPRQQQRCARNRLIVYWKRRGRSVRDR